MSGMQIDWAAAQWLPDGHSTPVFSHCEASGEAQAAIAAKHRMPSLRIVESIGCLLEMSLNRRPGHSGRHDWGNRDRLLAIRCVEIFGSDLIWLLSVEDRQQRAGHDS